MPVIYCKLNLFDAMQTVHYQDDTAMSECACVEMKELGHTIATVCNETNCFTVKVIGNKSYAESIADDIRVCNAFMYKNNTIEVEVIEE